MFIYRLVGIAKLERAEGFCPPPLFGNRTRVAVAVLVEEVVVGLLWYGFPAEDGTRPVRDHASASNKLTRLP